MSNVTAGDHYVAMGSSFASGPGVSPRSPSTPRRAQRSAANYAHLLAARLNVDLTDVTYSGETAAQLLRGGSGRPAQVDALLPTTKLVTLTCGGNDVGYIPVLFGASLPRAIGALPPLRRRLTGLMEATDARFDRLPEVFDDLLAEVYRRSPQAIVVVVDYLTLLPPEGTAAPPLPPDVAQWGRQTAERLSHVTAAAAERAGCVLIAASTASQGHHAWSAQPWTHRFRLGRHTAPYHPNGAGMQAVADLLTEALA